MKKLFAEFKEFIQRGNVLDMAVGVVMATAFGKITSALINNLLLPFLGWLFGSQDMGALNVTLSPAVIDPVTNEVTKEAVVLGFGTFVGAILDFLLIALTVFIIVKTMNKARAAAEKLSKKNEPAPEEEKPAEPSAEEKLLTEIRDLLKEK
ncbi:MAG: large conductance mechanosensitive channel protein MscL [Oscillospiraceae bacterium]|nr:large conductance mechanosensitive channel protein MscL [Oscillospiraceae bacterium]MBR2897801.1 large conductance mechanosensitive channel protein MscL [Oscillospiraceae bacterium]MBR2977715.1 large conductance mechanosensitive channel protein MscL [Oscillospiraceae bacterium]MBR3849754.1 large conductance mechanosensitive channel protein MscL [Oscillospiraceae bacterium]